MEEGPVTKTSALKDYSKRPASSLLNSPHSKATVSKKKETKTECKRTSIIKKGHCTALSVS